MEAFDEIEKHAAHPGPTFPQLGFSTGV